MMCCARYTEDDTWYRAEVVEVIDRYVGVVFIDYGNTEFVMEDR